MVERGLLSVEQLHEALRHQLIVGGHLGTSLVELGYTDEDQLGRVLAEVHDVPYAPAAMFDDIPREILESVPVDVIRQRRVVPIGVEGRALHLAAVHPRRLGTVSTATRKKVVPYVAPEVRIVEAMEQYYGIAREPRYVRLSTWFRGHRYARVVPRMDAESSPRLCGELRRLSDSMSRVCSHGELGEVVLDYVGRRARRSILFSVLGEIARVANWRGMPFDPDGAGGVEVAVTPDSVFGLVLDESYYRGPIPAEQDCRDFFDTLGVAAPGECLILPLYGDDGLFGVLYADGGETGQVEGDTETYLRLLERIGLAQKMLAYRLRLSAAC